MLRRMSSLTGWEKDNFTVLRCRCITDLTLEMEKMQMQCFFIRSHGHQGGWCNIWKLYFQSVWNIAPEISILKTAFHSVYHNLDTFVPGGPSVFGKSTVQIIISSPLHYWWWYCSWKSEDFNKRRHFAQVWPHLNCLEKDSVELVRTLNHSKDTSNCFQLLMKISKFRQTK